MNMNRVFVQFADGTQQVVVAVFAGPQDPQAFPNIAEVDHADERYLAFIDPASTLAGAKAAKLAQLAVACSDAIVAGFDSSALGATYHYPAKLTDQANLTGSVVASLLPNRPSDWTTPFWCCSADGVWAMRSHTQAQIQQVGEDAKAAVLDALARSDDLAAQVNAATSVEAVQAISWA